MSTLKQGEKQKNKPLSILRESEGRKQFLVFSLIWFRWKTANECSWDSEPDPGTHHGQPGSSPVEHSKSLRRHSQSPNQFVITKAFSSNVYELIV
jgi:hypothetical protein